MESVATAVEPTPDTQAPLSPQTIEDTGLAVDSIEQLLVKTLYGGEASGLALSDRLCLPYSLFEPLLEACAGEPDSASASTDFLEPIIERLNVPRRVADAVRRIVAQLPRLYAGRPGRFSRTPLYAPACEVLALLGEAHPKLDAFLETAPRKKRRRKTTRS